MKCNWKRWPRPPMSYYRSNNELNRNEIFKNIVNSDNFDYFKGPNKFVADHSELSKHKDGTDRMFPVTLFTNEIGTVGFAMRSVKTNAVKIFKLEKTVYNDDGDCVKWIYVPLAKDLKATGVTVEVFND